MWFHYVKQSPRTIAVNYCKKHLDNVVSSILRFQVSDSYRFQMLKLHLFLAGYDMQFDIKYAYFNFLQSINPTAWRECYKNLLFDASTRIMSDSILVYAKWQSAVMCCINFNWLKILELVGIFLAIAF